MNSEKEPLSIQDLLSILPEGTIIRDEDVVIGAGYAFPLCTMCKKSRLNCENYFIRERRLGTEIVDGVEMGIIQREDEISMPFVCQWFDPKDPG